MYIPRVGDSVVAKRKVKSKEFNTIVGPVVETFENSCKIITNENTELETHFVLSYNDYDFCFLHLTDEEYIDLSTTNSLKV